MTTGAREATLREVLQHSRNKFFDVFPARLSLGLKLTRKLSGALAAIRTALLRFAGYSVVVSEQAVEVPFVFRQIRSSDKKVLDFGAFESMLPLQLAALGHDVTVWDQRPYPFRHQRLHVICEDILKAHSVPLASFDVVMSISTIEHLGLGNYGDTVATSGDEAAVQALWRMVKPGGRLIVTVPAGVHSVQRGYRIYDEENLNRVFGFATDFHYFMKSSRAGEWSEVGACEALNHRYESPNATMPVEAVAIAIAEKPA